MRREAKKTTGSVAKQRSKHLLAQRQRDAMQALHEGKETRLLVVPYFGGKRQWMVVTPISSDTAPQSGVTVVALAGGVIQEGVVIDKDGRTFATNRRDYYDSTVKVLGSVKLTT